MPPSTAVPMLQQLLAHYIQSAGAAHARGDHGAAKEWCGHALRMAPDMPEAWFSLGLALRGLNHATEAVKAFVKAGTLTQRSAEAQNSIGVQLLELGADADALWDTVHVKIVGEARDADVPLGLAEAAAEKKARGAELAQYQEVWSFVRRRGKRSKQGVPAQIGRAHV